MPTIKEWSGVNNARLPQLKLMFYLSPNLLVTKNCLILFFIIDQRELTERHKQEREKKETALIEEFSTDIEELRARLKKVHTMEICEIEEDHKKEIEVSRGKEEGY